MRRGAGSGDDGEEVLLVLKRRRGSQRTGLTQQLLTPSQQSQNMRTCWAFQHFLPFCLSVSFFSHSLSVRVSPSLSLNFSLALGLALSLSLGLSLSLCLLHTL